MYTPGKESSEFKAGRAIIYLGIVMAVIVSIGDLAITPESVQAQLIILSENAEAWTKVLAPYIAWIYTAYTASRAYVKSKKSE